MEAICLLPPVAGDCAAYTPAWYYDSHSGRCETFVYGGCGGMPTDSPQRKGVKAPAVVLVGICHIQGQGYNAKFVSDV